MPTRSVGVHRSRILQRLRAARDARIVSVVAPAGYGKTTVLAQLAAGLPGRVAWVTVDAAPNDAIVLLDVCRGRLRPRRVRGAGLEVGDPARSGGPG